jgi:serine/threonine-protein kinase
VAPSVPKALQKVVTRALKVKLKDRYFDAATVERHLEAYLAKKVKMSHAALLIAFLKQRNKISEVDALSRVSSREMSLAELSIAVTFDGVEPLRPRRSYGRWLLLAAAGLGAGAFFARHLWMPLLGGL